MTVEEPNRNPPWINNTRYVVIKDPTDDSYYVALRMRARNEQGFQPIQFKSRGLAKMFCQRVNEKTKDYLNELIDHKYALVGTRIVEIKSVDIDDDDIVATDIITKKTESYSIKHSGLYSLRENEVDHLLEIHRKEGERGLYLHIFDISEEEYEKLIDNC